MNEIKLKQPEDFLKVAETLTRMGIANNQDKILWQSCHILHCQQRYYISHFKELMALDGKVVTMTDEDTLRLDSITKTLETWGLVELVDDKIETVTNNFRVIKHSQKFEWKLFPKYKIGNTQ